MPRIFLDFLLYFCLFYSIYITVQQVVPASKSFAHSSFSSAFAWKIIGWLIIVFQFLSFIFSYKRSNTRKRSANKTYRGTIRCRVVGSIYVQLRQSTNSYLLNVRHKIVGNALWIFSKFATFMSSYWVEISQQYDIPILICLLNIPSNIFKKELIN